jgi:hypothetical protein
VCAFNHVFFSGHSLTSKREEDVPYVPNLTSVSCSPTILIHQLSTTIEGHLPGFIMEVFNIEQSKGSLKKNVKIDITIYYNKIVLLS